MSSVQGIMGTTPWNALVFLTFYLELLGMGDLWASLLVHIGNRLAILIDAVLCNTNEICCKLVSQPCTYAPSRCCRCVLRLST